MAAAEASSSGLNNKKNKNDMSLLDTELVVPNVDSDGEGNVEDIGVDLFGGSEDERDFYGFDSDGNDVDIVTSSSSESVHSSSSSSPLEVQDELSALFDEED